MEQTIKALIEMFVATKQTEGRTAKTTEWYRQMITRFADYLGAEPTIKDFTIDNARLFIASLQQRETRYPNHPWREEVEGKLSANTVDGYVRALKAFSSWLAEEGYTRTNILSRLKRPKLPETMIQVLSDEEVQTILEGINENTLLGARQYLIVLLLYDTGIRAQELCTLTLDNVDLEENVIKVMGKGRKERIVPFGSRTKKYLQRYLTTWRPEPDREDNNFLFLSPDGSPLTYSNLSHMIKRLGVNAGIPRLHAHLFRHSFAVRYLMNGGDPMSLKRILGHTTLDVTQVYMHLADDHLKVLHRRFSPVDHLALETGRKKRHSAA